MTKLFGMFPHRGLVAAMLTAAFAFAAVSCGEKETKADCDKKGDKYEWKDDKCQKKAE